MRNAICALAGCGLVACIMIGVAAMGIPACADANGPVRLIFDTDIGNDIDDALALAMIHTLADRGEVDLLAVTVNKDNPWAGVYVDVANHFYGRPSTPVGTVRDGKTPDDGKYVRQVAERKAGGEFVYPRTLKTGADAPEAVSLLRKTLASQPDGSVVIVSVGFMTNLARLLESEADALSPLDGKELARRKVLLYVMMAGCYEPAGDRDYNVVMDAESARRVFAEWPTPIVASGFEIGREILYPGVSIQEDFAYVRDHPIAEAYRAYDKMPYDRPTWDLTAVLYAVRPDRGYFGLSPAGKIVQDAENYTRFTPMEGGIHRYLTVTPEQKIRVLEALTWAASAPPAGKR